MAFTAKQLADGQLGNSEADLYSPSGVKAVIVTITLCNTDTSTRNVKLYIKPSGGTSRKIFDADLLASQAVAVTERLTLDDGDALRGYSAVASKVDYTVSGAEE